MTDEARNYHPETLAAQALGWIDETTKAIVPPLHFSTTFIRDPDNEYRHGRSYARPKNPSFEQPEALTFASGMAAAAAVFFALKPGDHVVVPKVMYWALRNWLQTFASEWGLDVAFVDAASIDAIAAAMQPGRPSSCGSRRRRTRPGSSPTSPPPPRSRTRPARCSRSTPRSRRRC